MSRIGVDLGGTKVEAILVGDNGTIEARERLATPRFNYERYDQKPSRSWLNPLTESPDACVLSAPVRPGQ